MTTITRYTKGFVRYLRNNRAVSALEYAILVGIIAVGIATALGLFVEDLGSALENIGGEVAKSKGSTPTIP